MYVYMHTPELGVQPARTQGLLKIWVIDILSVIRSIIRFVVIDAVENISQKPMSDNVVIMT